MKPMKAITVARVSVLSGYRERFKHLWVIKVYKAVPRKADGVYTWRLVETQRVGPVSTGRLIRLSRLRMKEERCPYIKNLRQGTLVDISPTEMLALTWAGLEEEIEVDTEATAS